MDHEMWKYGLDPSSHTRTGVDYKIITQGKTYLHESYIVSPIGQVLVQTRDGRGVPDGLGHVAGGRGRPVQAGGQVLCEGLEGEVLLLGRGARRAQKAHPQDQVAQERVAPEDAAAEELAQRDLQEGHAHEEEQHGHQDRALQAEQDRLSFS